MSKLVIFNQSKPETDKNFFLFEETAEFKSRIESKNHFYILDEDYNVLSIDKSLEKLDSVKDIWGTDNIFMTESIQIPNDKYLEQMKKIKIICTDYVNQSKSFNHYNLFQYIAGKIVATTQYFSIFNILRPEVRNKFIVFGSGGFTSQMLPKFIIDDIIKNNSFWDIIIVEPCGPQWGCPSVNITEKIPEDKKTNAYFFHFKSGSDLIPILYILINNQDLFDKFIIYDAMDHIGKQENEYNLFIGLGDDENSVQFSNTVKKLINEQKIVLVYAINARVIYFDYIKQKFDTYLHKIIGNCVDYSGSTRVCTLDIVSLDDVLNSKYKEKIEPIESVGGNIVSYKEKYLKYKNKYLQLKKQLN
jgi:hypothetical protein